MNPSERAEAVEATNPSRFSWSWLAYFLRWLPFVSLVLCLLSWVCLEVVLNQPTRGLEGLGQAISAYFVLLFWISSAVVGTVLAMVFVAIDLAYKQRLSKELCAAILLNVLIGPALIYGIHLREYYKNTPPIVRAVDSEDTSKLEEILIETEDPARPSDAANVAITVALANNDYASIVVLVDYFADAEGWTFSIEEALGWLAHDGHQETWERLLNRGMSADAKVRINLDHLVCRAARYGSPELLRKALKEGGDPNATQGGRTALEWAHWGGGYSSANCVDLLYEYGAKFSKTNGT